MKRSVHGVHGGIKILLFIAGIFCAAGCEFTRDTERGFMSQWKAWESKNIKNYSFILKGELPYWNFPRAILMEKYEVKITIKNDVMDSFEYTGKVPRPEEDINSILEPEFVSISDISDMYRKIYDRAQEEREWWKANPDPRGIISTKYKIKYNGESCYITYFNPVSQWESDWIVDTTAHAVTVSDFRILEPSAEAK